jgi:hypothetical protein
LQGRKHEEEKLEYTVINEITEKEIPKVTKNKNLQQEDQHVSKLLQVFL